MRYSNESYSVTPAALVAVAEIPSECGLVEAAYATLAEWKSLIGRHAGFFNFDPERSRNWAARPLRCCGVFEHMQRNPIVSIPGAAEKIGISAPTIAKSLEHMRRIPRDSERRNRTDPVRLEPKKRRQREQRQAPEGSRRELSCPVAGSVEAVPWSALFQKLKTSEC